MSRKINKIHHGDENKNYDEDVLDKNTRYFAVIYEDSEGDVIKHGRFTGRIPRQAALKAFSSIVRDYKENGNKIDVAKFGLVEVTRNSKHKTYYYSGKRNTLDKPLKVQAGGNKIVFKHYNKVCPVRGDECSTLMECLGCN
jgi:hypothetical protein